MVLLAILSASPAITMTSCVMMPMVTRIAESSRELCHDSLSELHQVQRLNATTVPRRINSISSAKGIASNTPPIPRIPARRVPRQCTRHSPGSARGSARVIFFHMTSSKMWFLYINAN